MAEPAEHLTPPNEDLGQPSVSHVPVPRARRRFDPEPRREQMRGWLAVGSFVLLLITVSTIVLVVALGLRSWQEMEGVAASILPSVLSVVGSTVGFYFGAGQQRGGRL